MKTNKKMWIVGVFLVMFHVCMAQDTLIVPFATTSLTTAQKQSNPDYLLYPLSLSNQLPALVRDNTIQNITIDVNGVSFDMVYVEGGVFTMGATQAQTYYAEADEKPTHLVGLSNFYIGQTEVTQELWEAVMGNNPSSNTSNVQNPVEQITWNDCQIFLEKLNQITGMCFRLPKEAEWEFAARGGKFGHDNLYAGGSSISRVACYNGKTTQIVAQKLPNELGIYDMSGNVSEFCQDRYGAYTNCFEVNPIGIDNGKERINRGGNATSKSTGCRVSGRGKAPATHKSGFLGLRLALDSDQRTNNSITGIHIVSIDNISVDSAVVSCYASEIGMDEIKEYGVCYSETEHPTYDNQYVRVDSIRIEYSCVLKKLKSNTLYYIRPYMKNKYGISYGEEKTILTHDQKTFFVNGVSFTMVKVHGGTFTMGATEEQANDDEKPAHQVSLSNYWIGQTEVTQALWEAVMGYNPTKEALGENKPVANVSWENCQSFIDTLNALSGQQFRLPTEAEWEYAARGGIYSKGFLYSGTDSYQEIWSKYYYAWKQDVATKKSNELGIYDMSGNVEEYCLDGYGPYTNKYQVNPINYPNSNRKVIRGGSITTDYGYLRVSSRKDWYNNDYIGLRLAIGDSIAPLVRLPEVVTLPITNQLGTSALIGGEVLDNGGGMIIEQGLCYSTSSMKPTIEDEKIIVSRDSTRYTYKLTYLQEQTIYYVRAYAINSMGVQYGEVKAFKTKDAIKEAIDLGLSVKWASFNIGAYTPEGDGDIFAWGELNPKEKYVKDTYRWIGEYGRFTKYNEQDKKTVLEALDDAATMNWGLNWRMPTQEEFSELRTNCTWTPHTQNGVNGYLITSNINGNQIFLPSVEYRKDTISYRSFTYLSSSLSSRSSSHVYTLTDGTYGYSDATPREEGRQIRPVWREIQLPTMRTLNVSICGDTAILDGEVTHDGGALINECGFVYGTIQNPTIEDNKLITAKSNSIEIGRFSDTIFNLQHDVVYYVRAYAMNAGGVAYGNEFSFTTTKYLTGEGELNGYSYVCLGLSVKWANVNIGYNTKKYGVFGTGFAWGEVEPIEEAAWSLYKWYAGKDYWGNLRMKKYNTDDSITLLEPDDDAASTNWGASWRMPTSDEFKELYENCIWIWSSYKDKFEDEYEGYAVKSKINGDSIFLPATGYQRDSGHSVRTDGMYWSSSLNTDDVSQAKKLIFTSSYINAGSRSRSRYYGLYIRPVCP